MPDNHKNFAYSTVLTPPSPAISGTSLVVSSLGGLLFPTPPFNATVWPANTQPLADNAEIVRVTGISTDTFTIVRAQENSTARAITAGDQIAATVTVKTLTDVELSLPTTSAGSPEGILDGNPGRPAYDTIGVRNWIKTTTAGTLTGWQ